MLDTVISAALGVCLIAHSAPQAESGAIFLSVRDGDPDIKYSSLYLSDSTGHSWSISMK